MARTRLLSSWDSVCLLCSLFLVAGCPMIGGGGGNTDPIGAIAPLFYCDPDEPITLDGSESFDPDGDPLTFTWTQTGGTPVTLIGADTATATFTAPNVNAPETPTFTLVVSDDRGGTGTATVLVDLSGGGNANPIAIIAPVFTPDPGEIVTLDLSASLDPDGDPLTFTLTQTGGTTVALNWSAGFPERALATFTAPNVNAPETLTFTLVVCDGRGGTDTATVLVDLAGGAPLYGADVVTDQLWNIDKNTGSGDAIGATGLDSIVGLACDIDTGVLYAVLDSSPPSGASSELLTLNPDTGAATLIGEIGFDAVKGLAYDRENNRLFGVTSLDELLAIEPATGLGVLVGSIGSSFLDSLAYHEQQDMLYAVDIGDDPDTLYRIDPDTGAGVVVGTIGFDNVSGLAYDAGTNRLYGAARATGSLITLDTATGVGSLVGSLPNTGFNGLASCFEE